MYRLDWAAIARSGVFDASAGEFRFYLLTLTAPSFGRVHRVPRSGGKVKRCGCGATHDHRDVDFRGVPLDPASYDYAGQVAWNRDAGILWDRTNRRLRDRWATLEFFKVGEWQARGVLHFHVLLRISRGEFSSRELIREAARSARAYSLIDGGEVRWGDQVDVARFRGGGDGAKTIWYLSKALNYVLKDTARDALSDWRTSATSQVWRHLIALEAAARRMRCSLDCALGECRSAVHKRYGARSHVVTATRQTKRRPGWSFIGLTRAEQRRRRQAWVAATTLAVVSNGPPRTRERAAAPDRQRARVRPNSAVHP